MYEKELQILSIGEALIDFIGDDISDSLSKTQTFSQHIGGSATNLALNCSKLGMKTQLIASVGDDEFGQHIIDAINLTDVNTSAIKQIKNKKTSKIYISRSVSTPDFKPEREADFHIDRSQISKSEIARAKIFHTTCFALSKNPSQSVILENAKIAFDLGLKLSLDVNFSQKIWHSRETAISVIKSYCQYNPLIKISSDDCERLFGESVSKQEMFNFFHNLGVDFVCLTKGKNGVEVSQNGKEIIYFEAVKIDKIADSTGAGDAFWAGFLTAFVKNQNTESCINYALNVAAVKLINIGSLPNDILDIIPQRI